jgi:CheY-like chemotaxis protein/anti-sigma regulatory factor (Ser/Thr protein kinase)
MIKRCKELSGITMNLSVLYAEDEKVSRLRAEYILRALFKDFFIAEDGVKALEIYRSQKIDLILTDNQMPGMSGLELIKEIRKTDLKVPIVLITAYIDTAILIDAINNRVTHFIAKPFSYDNLLDAIEIAVRIVVFENVVQKAQAQELELLRYKEKYHAGQQEMAFRKEINIISNDLFMKKVAVRRPDSTPQDWLVESYYSPMDVMCGDSYSVRDLGDGRVFLFLIDAMGKGLSASVTSVISTSFINHIVDNALKKGAVGLNEIIGQYIDFIRKDLLDDEIVCATFLLPDFFKETMEMAVFAMPEILGMQQDEALVTFMSNNLPIMKYSSSWEIDRIDISRFSKILVHTDGLNESMTVKHALYGERLKHDFAGSLFLGNLTRRFMEAVEQPGDDITLFLIKRVEHKIIWEHNFSIKTRLSELSRVAEEIEKILASAAVGKTTTAEFICVFNELLRNAYEHGNLKITCEQKIRLIEQDSYDDFLLEQEAGTAARIEISLFLYEKSGHEVLTVMITDEGAGFDILKLRQQEVNDYDFAGRGIKMAQSLVDEIYYNEKGNSVTMSIDLSEQDLTGR